ncbi:MAG: hypothetical protein AABY32_00530 [Nanoarchaeota archaeon]
MFGRNPTMAKKEKRIMKKIFKKGIVTEYLPWLLIALVVLVIVLISIFFLKEKGVSFIDQIKNLFRRS